MPLHAQTARLEMPHGVLVAFAIAKGEFQKSFCNPLKSFLRPSFKNPRQLSSKELGTFGIQVKAV